MNPAIFKAYDIRGIYGEDFNEDTAYKIGRAAARFMDAKSIAVGRDVRPSSDSLFAALANGINDEGCAVIDLGIVTTPMVYFASGALTVDGAISLTASHNTIEWNGFKFCRQNAVPIGEDSGLKEIAQTVLNDTFDTPTQERGDVIVKDIKDAYYDHFATFAKLEDKKFSLIIDCANAMGVYELPIYKKFAENLSLEIMYDDLEHPLTAHEANPLKTETLDELSEKMKQSDANLGIAYDGDADRVGFVDEHGTVIPMDLITGLIAQIVLQEHPGARILYDLRSSRAVAEVIEENSGVAAECRVGHAFIKKQMREEDAEFAGELSGHYYFKNNSNAEASTLAALYLLNLMTETGKPISELVQDLRRYHHSGEINSEVENKTAVLNNLKQTYTDGELSELDGVKISYPDWWFSVRASNTEPVLRLNLEANTKEMMEEKRDELLAHIRG